MTDAQIQEVIEHRAVPHPTSALELVETHISWVLLGDDYVYKIKKPLKLSFLDFSTPEKRYFFCQQELLLNRRLAPGMYQDVLPVYENGSRTRIGGKKGRIVDSVVLMKRMDPSRQMDLLLEKGNVDAAAIHALADKLAAFHLGCQKIRKGEGWKTLYEEFADIQSVQGFLKDHFGEKTGQLVEDALEWAFNYLSGIRKQLRERLARGFVVDGHGDLHCRNIFLLEEPVIFDCIEFNEDFRKLDVLSEVAFLCMDLERFERADLAEVFCEHYFSKVHCLANQADRQLFLFYKMYRANVRIKVMAIRMQEEEGQPEQQQGELALLKRYLYLFGQYYSNLSHR